MQLLFESLITNKAEIKSNYLFIYALWHEINAIELSK